MKTFLAFTASLLAASAETYRIDGAHSAANFSVRHMMVSNVRGQLGRLSGTVEFDAANLAASKVTASVDVKAINTNEPKRDDHLRSADFFDVAQFPNAMFESTKWWKDGDKVKVAGNLTMHGVTKPVTLDLEVSAPVKDAKGGSRIGATATGKINRKDFGITWNRMLDNGGVTVSDEVQVTLDIAATLAR
jgi:polyisoprenoid-binding protein YceI